MLKERLVRAKREYQKCLDSVRIDFGTDTGAWCVYNAEGRIYARAHNLNDAKREAMKLRKIACDHLRPEKEKNRA
jgi:hypothetical protein